MVRIIPNQDFTHRGVQFSSGQNYDVSIEDAEYFAAAGWIGELRSKQDQTLDIHDLGLGHSINVL